MKKIILMVMVAFTFISCQLAYEVIDIIGTEYAKDHDLYYSADFNELQNYDNVYRYIRNNISYRTDDTEEWSNPENTLNRGYGDCEDYAILFLNICYFVTGEKCNIVTVDYSDVKSVVDGGIPNHAIVELPSGLLYEPQTGQIVEYKSIMYRYDFDLVFNK